MSLERAVFAPLDRLADALHPYRWHFVLVALLSPAVFFGLAFSGEQYWPEQSSKVLGYAAPFVATLMAWGWGARLLVAWYGTHRRARLLRHVPPEVLDPFGGVKRVWHLLVLLVFLLSPFPVWLVWYAIYRR